MIGGLQECQTKEVPQTRSLPARNQPLPTCSVTYANRGQERCGQATNPVHVSLLKLWEKEARAKTCICKQKQCNAAKPGDGAAPE